MTGKKSDSTTRLSKAERERLAAELAYHDESAAAIESRTGQKDTYHHETAARLRAELKQAEVEDDGKLE